MAKLPKTIFVSMVNDGHDNEYLEASTEITRFDDGTVVGEYRLVSLNTKRITHELDQKKARK